MKYADIGNCPAMSSCQMWVLAPSSASCTTPYMEMLPRTHARAVNDIAIGRNALGFLLSERTELAYRFVTVPEVAIAEKVS
jgi:hypothetical protein